jgi:hypothetical protein
LDCFQTVVKINRNHLFCYTSQKNKEIKKLFFKLYCLLQLELQRKNELLIPESIDQGFDT